MIDLKFDHVSKRYSIRQEAERTTPRHPLLRKIQSLRQRTQDFWAVRDVSFAVERGEAVGVIGHNGAGKSTILKLLANITAPTSGEIIINGRLSALIEVGSGFHPELTGRENIYLSGSILGMRRREITNKLDNIIDFAGVRQFVDTPVKRYSSGMYVRLGFSIAAHLDPDILLLDEVLAVGDAAFQSKCLERIEELKRLGKTIIFISHDLAAVERLCHRVILLDHGKITRVGAPNEVIAEYERAATTFTQAAPPGGAANNLRRTARVVGLSFLDRAGHETSEARTGEPLTLQLRYEAVEKVADTVVEVFFHSQTGNLECQLTSERSGGRVTLERGAGVIEFHCTELPLQPGMYYIDTAIEMQDWQYRCAALRVDPGIVKGTTVQGAFYMPHQLRFIQTEGPLLRSPVRYFKHIEATVADII